MTHQTQDEIYDELGLIALADLADLISVSRNHVHNLITQGEFDVVKSGRRTLVTVASVRAYIKRNTTTVGAAPPPAGVTITLLLFDRGRSLSIWMRL